MMIEVKQQFAFIQSNNCYEKKGKHPSRHFRLIQWLLIYHVTKVKSTINSYSKNNSKLSVPAPSPDKAIQH